MPIFTKKLFAENYVVTSSVTSMSIAQASGSTIFGDSADDTHLFIGSTISGSAASTASFGKYENITSFAGADGTEALFSGSAASTGSFGRVENNSGKFRITGTTGEISAAELTQLHIFQDSLGTNSAAPSLRLSNNDQGNAYDVTLSVGSYQLNVNGHISLASHTFKGTGFDGVNSRGTAGTALFTATGNGGDGGGMYFGGGGAYDVRFSTTEKERLRIDTEGNGGGIQTSGSLQVGSLTSGATSDITATGNISGSSSSTGSFGQSYIVDNSHVGGILTVGSTSTPDATYGDGSIELFGNGSTALVINDTRSSNRRHVVFADTGGMTISSDPSNTIGVGYFRVKVANSEVFRIAEGGNTGIGVTDPDVRNGLLQLGSSGGISIIASGNISGSSTSTGSFGHLNIDGPGFTISDNKTASVSGNSSILCVGSGSMPVYYGNVIGVKHATNASFKLQTDVSGSVVGSGFEFGLGSTAAIINRSTIDHVVYGTANIETMRHRYSASGIIVGINSGGTGLANHGGAGITLGGLNTVTRVKVCSSQTGIGANNGLEFIMSTGDATIFNRESADLKLGTGNSSDQLKIINGTDSQLLRLDGSKISGSAASTGSFGTVQASHFTGDGAGLTNVPDYVFEPEYVLRSLSDVEEFVSESKHLPGIPSMNDMSEWKQYSVGDRDMLLLEKIEELTLYVIRLEKRIKDLENN